MAEPPPEHERVKLSQAASYLLDECRMVLPGVQAIFGFQLIAVFNQRFARTCRSWRSACTSRRSPWWRSPRRS